MLMESESLDCKENGRNSDKYSAVGIMFLKRKLLLSFLSATQMCISSLASMLSEFYNHAEYVWYRSLWKSRLVAFTQRLLEY